jgi:hypothetical protein
MILWAIFHTFNQLLAAASKLMVYFAIMNFLTLIGLASSVFLDRAYLMISRTVFLVQIRA